MGTIHREAGLRFIIFVDDHPPPHVHVFGDGEAKIALKGADGELEILYAIGMSRADLRRAERIARNLREEFLMKWTAIHG